MPIIGYWNTTSYPIRIEGTYEGEPVTYTVAQGEDALLALDVGTATLTVVGYTPSTHAPAITFEASGGVAMTGWGELPSQGTGYLMEDAP